MTTDTLTKEDVELFTGTDKSKVAHYVKKDSIVDAVVFGNSVEALCGYVWVPSRDPKNLPVCQECLAVYNDNEAMTNIKYGSGL